MDSSPADVVVRFNLCINSRDLDGLSALMADEHVFIDAAETSIDGKEACLRAWRGFFEQFPDYRNIFDRIVARDGEVAIGGRSTCSDARLDGPALWAATVWCGQVRQWRVCEDTPANRKRLGLNEPVR